MSLQIQSSFNGCEFYVRGIATTGFNNQVVMHDIVNGKYGPYIEVMGRGAEVYEVDAFVSYNSGTYFDKEILKQQFMNNKTGMFFHPDYGMMNCCCLNISISEDAMRKGVCDIRFQLVVVNNSYYSITTTSSSSSLSSLVQRAANVISNPVSSISSELSGTSLGIISGGEGILKSISGIDPVLNKMGQTLGRYYQMGQMGASTLNEVSTLSEGVNKVEQNTSSIRSTLSSGVI